MIKYNYKKRLTIAEIKDHPWFNGPVATAEEVAEELAARKKEIKKRLGEDDFTDETTLDSYREEYEETVIRSLGDKWVEEELEMKCRVYDKAYARNTEFFSRYPVKFLLGAFLNYFEKMKIDLKLSPHTYKANVSVAGSSGDIVSFNCQILKVLENGKKGELVDGDSSDDSEYYIDPDHEEDDESDKNLYCFQFRKKKGPMADFLKTIKDFR